ncbi:hypothetical protein [Caballeronia zhejiangensis]|uniref:hypothetical protein n=1 Tax=Caballeronia zhejiangensis TaxID=871203 RepID=UPI001267C89A|nr:hypothetical protein [Caballeronia zhejiangensis]
MPIGYPTIRPRVYTLADYQRAYAVFIRDTEATRERIEAKLAQLQEQEARGRALMTVASLPFDRSR